MKKFIYLLISALYLCPALLHAQDAEDIRYLEGAVPEQNGKVVFSKEFNISGMNQQEIMSRTQSWMEELLQRNHNNSRILFTDEAQGVVVGTQDHYIVFSSSALSLDRTRMVCQLTATAQPEKLNFELSKIKYFYYEGNKEVNYPAEEMISDDYALNKAHTKLVRGYAKWRRKTVDYVDSLYISLANALSATQESIKRQETTNQAVRGNQQVVVINKETATPKTKAQAKEQPISEPAKEAENTAVSAVSEVVNATPVVTKAAEKPVVNASAAPNTKPEKTTTPPVSVPGYEESDPGELNSNMIQAGSGKLVIAIGSDIYNMTTITANAGGSIGQMNGKTVVYTILSPDQDASLLDNAQTYSVRFVPNNSDKATLIMECKKLPSQKAAEGMPQIYIGEIQRVLTSK